MLRRSRLRRAVHATAQVATKEHVVSEEVWEATAVSQHGQEAAYPDTVGPREFQKAPDPADAACAFESTCVSYHSIDVSMHFEPGNDLLEGLLSRKRPAAAPLDDLYERDQGLPLGPTNAGHLAEGNPPVHQPGHDIRSAADPLSQEDQEAAGNLPTAEDTDEAAADREDSATPMLTETLAMGAQDMTAQMHSIEEKIQHLAQHSVQRLDAIKECLMAELSRFVQGLRASCNVQNGQWYDLAADTVQESKRLDMAKELVGSLGIAASMPHATENGQLQAPPMAMNSDGPGI